MSLSKLIYSNSTDIFDHISSCDQSSVIVITPNPVFADALRLQIAEIENNEKFTVDTISNFVKRQIKLNYEDEFAKNYIKNSELFLYLTIAWDQQGFGDFYEFKKGFKLLTDLRSFSTNLDLFAEYFDVIDEEEAKKIKFLWSFMDVAELWDEQKLYLLLSSLVFEEDVSFCFIGFDFLSGNQIDAINSIGSQTKVYVPLPEGLIEKCNSLDWVDWLEGEVVNLGSSDEVENVEIEFFDQSTLYDSFLSKLSDLDSKDSLFITCCDPAASIESEIQFILDRTNFKIPVDIFETELFDLENLFQADLKSYSRCQDLRLKFVELINTSIKLNSYKNIKIYSELLKLLDNLNEKFPQIETISNVTLKALMEVLTMNLPRINFTSKTSSGNWSYRGYKHLGIPLKKNDIIFLIIKKKYPDFSVYKEFDESLYKLASIGPVRRSEFEHEIKLKNFKNALKGQATVIFVENGVVEEQPSWKSVLEDIRLQDNNKAPREYLRKKTGYLKALEKSKVEKFSASAIQMFVDCPRKYYLTYIEKLRLQIESNLQFSARDEGIVFHKVVQEFFLNFNEINSLSLMETGKNVLNKYLEDQNKKLIEIDYTKTLYKVFSLSENILKCLFKLNNNEKVLSIDFEESFYEEKNHYTYSGFLDLVVRTELGTIIFDFKRSSSTIPSGISFANFESIQLWFYALHSEIENIVGVGYMCGSDDSKSIFYGKDSTVLDFFKELDIAKIPRNQVLTNENLLNYEGYENTLVEKINSGKDIFDPNPKNESICGFCSFDSVCPKGAIDV